VLLSAANKLQIANFKLRIAHLQTCRLLPDLHLIRGLSDLRLAFGYAKLFICGYYQFSIAVFHFRRLPDTHHAELS
jgi:hypothetical protein